MVSVLTYYFSSIAMELFKGVLLCFMKVIRINKDFKMNALIAIYSYPKVFSIFWEGGGMCLRN